MIEEIPYVSIALFVYEDPLTNKAIYDKLSKIKTIDNFVIDKSNRDQEINVECGISGVEKNSNGTHGTFIYNEQLKERDSEKYRIYPTPQYFTIAPSQKLVIIYGKADNAKKIKTILDEFLHSNESNIQNFKGYEISKSKMKTVCKNIILKANEGNYCERPRITHGNKKFQGHSFHDYSNGVGKCTMNTKEFDKEFPNATGISPILKVKYCPYLMDESVSGYKTIRFKKEGTIYFSGSAYPSEWLVFLSKTILS